MDVNLLVVAALTAGWAWLQYAGERTHRQPRRREPSDILR